MLQGFEMVLAFAGKSKDNVTIRVDQSIPVHTIATSIGMVLEFKVNKATSSNIVEQDAFTTIMANPRNAHNLHS